MGEVESASRGKDPKNVHVQVEKSNRKEGNRRKPKKRTKVGNTHRQEN